MYAHELKGGQVDNNGKAINSEWVSTRMYVPEGLAGEDITKDALGNTSHIDKISCPRQPKILWKMRTLFIGEDSGYHVNNYLWAYNVDTKNWRRIFVNTSRGLSQQVYTRLMKSMAILYIMSNFQHQVIWHLSPPLRQQFARSLTKTSKMATVLRVGYLAFKSLIPCQAMICKTQSLTGFVILFGNDS